MKFVGGFIDESGDIAELNVDDGVDKFLLRLDKWYKKDDISAQYDTWTKFVTYQTQHGVSIDSYISEFTKRNNAMKKFKSTISGSILAFMLLDNAGLDYKDKQLVLTGVSFEDESKMLELMQKSLKKYCSSQEVFSGNSQACSTGAKVSSISIKSELVFKTK